MTRQRSSRYEYNRQYHAANREHRNRLAKERRARQAKAAGRDPKTGPRTKTVHAFEDYLDLVTMGETPERAVETIGRNLSSFTRLAYRNGRLDIATPLAAVEQRERHRRKAASS